MSARRSRELSPATTEVFAAADVFSTLQGVPPRFRASAVFMAELSTINEIQHFETSNGAPLFPGVDSGNTTLLRSRLVENSNVDAHSGINVAATADNFILYAGEFSQYVILDRVGLTVAFIEPGVLQNTANNLPDSQPGHTQNENPPDTVPGGFLALVVLPDWPRRYLTAGDDSKIGIGVTD